MSSGARRREEARRKARRRRQLKAYGIPAAVVGAVLVVAVALSLGGPDTKARISPTFGPVTISAPARGAPLRVGESIPDFTANLLAGGTVRWPDYKGTPTVLALWAPWCPHCQKELPLLSRVMQEFPNVKLLTIVTAVDLHPGPTPDGFLKSRNLSMATALDDAGGTLGSAFGLQVFPLTYFVDATGVVRQLSEGESTPEQLRANIALLLG